MIFRSRNVHPDGAVLEITIWHVPAERGDLTERHHLSFSSWEQMTSTLTPARGSPWSATSAAIRSRASPLSPGRWGATTSVSTRTWRLWSHTAGLIERDRDGLRTEHDGIRTLITV